MPSELPNMVLNIDSNYRTQNNSSSDNQDRFACHGPKIKHNSSDYLQTSYATSAGIAMRGILAKDEHNPYYGSHVGQNVHSWIISTLTNRNEQRMNAFASKSLVSKI